ncbi:hypothetical protein SAMN02745673_04323 [Marinactinospora thermotolerans DSM 45154]|uniref:Uncharacterized protein n=1 Tax=Marinactinospora thermotolerans DSM 45154 TaxID=1122192 RepID=A0A1T4T2F4_9ACTN|nr:hypothetical protein SAMN02745673_04323 [Marinactinospora thermotolerans DSM 45154]
MTLDSTVAPPSLLRTTALVFGLTIACCAFSAFPEQADPLPVRPPSRTDSGIVYPVGPGTAASSPREAPAPSPRLHHPRVHPGTSGDSTPTPPPARAGQDPRPVPNPSPGTSARPREHSVRASPTGSTTTGSSLAVEYGRLPPRSPLDRGMHLVGSVSTLLLMLIAVLTLALRLSVGWPRFPPRYRGRRRIDR